jgi:hypothetical protein
MSEQQPGSLANAGSMAKKAYTTPALRVHGKASELTLGSGIGVIDIGSFGLANPGGGGSGGGHGTGPGWS